MKTNIRRRVNAGLRAVNASRSRQNELREAEYKSELHYQLAITLADHMADDQVARAMAVMTEICVRRGWIDQAEAMAETGAYCAELSAKKGEQSFILLNGEVEFVKGMLAEYLSSFRFGAVPIERYAVEVRDGETDAGRHLKGAASLFLRMSPSAEALVEVRHA